MDDYKKLNYINFALDRAYDIFDDMRDISLMTEKLRNRINEFCSQEYSGFGANYFEYGDKELEDYENPPFSNEELREATKELHDICDSTLNSSRRVISSVLDQITQATGLFSNTVHVLNDMYVTEYEAFQKKEDDKKNVRRSET